jgi:large subunit ribosomal protein L25
MNELLLTAQKRELSGKATQSLRDQGQLPAVAYGHGTEPESITLEAKATERVYSQAGSAKLVSLKLGEGQARNVIFQEVQHDPRSGAIIHADLYIVRMDEALEAEVPLHFIGESTAVYQDEGTLVKNVETVEVRCLPGDLPDSIEVDISVLDDFSKQINVSDLVMPKDVELMVEDPESVMVAKVEAPRSDEEMADLDAEIDEASELPEGVQEEDPAVVSEENEGSADRRDKK